MLLRRLLNLLRKAPLMCPKCSDATVLIKCDPHIEEKFLCCVDVLKCGWSENTWRYRQNTYYVDQAKGLNPRPVPPTVWVERYM
jgi:hypothetical protein